MQKPMKYEYMTWQERRQVRDAYVVSQGSKCHHCKSDIHQRPDQKKRIDLSKFPPNFLKYPIHLHHSHETGLTIGAVHAYCNAVLWQYHGE